MKLFQHPTQVCMTYLEHFCFSMEMAYVLCSGSFKAVVHAFYPDLYVTSTTDTVNSIKRRLKMVGCSK